MADKIELKEVSERPNQKSAKPEETLETTANNVSVSTVSLLARSVGKRFTMGTLLGALSGYAAKRFSKEAAYYLGLSFIALQILHYKGYIEVKWKTVLHDIESVLDQDGDGKFTFQDVRMLLKKFMKVLTTGLPSSAGFATGFYAALQWN